MERQWLAKLNEYDAGRMGFFSVALLAAVAVFGLTIRPAPAEIHFRAEILDVPGKPGHFLASDYWVVADIEGTSQSALLVAGGGAGLNPGGAGSSGWEQGIFVLKRSGSGLKMMGPFPVSGTGDLRACDIDGDGKEEVFVLGYDPQNQCMLRWKGNEFVQEKVPFPRYEAPVVVFEDFSGDGRPDLYLSGTEVVGKKGRPEQVVGRIYENAGGRFQATNIALKVKELVDTAHVIDYNEDGKPDLLLGVNTSLNMEADCCRIFVNRGDHFEKVRTPLVGYDELLGLSSASVAEVDFNGDGLDDLLMSGFWHEGWGGRNLYLARVQEEQSSGGREQVLPFVRSRPD